MDFNDDCMAGQKMKIWYSSNSKNIVDLTIKIAMIFLFYKKKSLAGIQVNISLRRYSSCYDVLAEILFTYLVHD